MNNILAVDFSTGLAAVLLGAAAIILIVMIAEVICMAKPRKAKGKKARAEAAPAEQTAAEHAAEEDTVTEASPQAQPEEEPEPVDKKPQETKPEAKVRGGLDKSFTAKLILSDGQTKSCYSFVKNRLLKSGFECRVCWRHESFRAVKKLCAKLAIRGGGLCLFCALDPDPYLNSAEEVEDLSDKKTYKNTPLLCRVNTGGGREISNRIIADLAQKFNAEKTQFEECDFAALQPCEDIQTLIEKGLVKVKIYRAKTKQKKVENNVKPQPEIAVKTAVKLPSGKREKQVKKTVKKGVKKVVNTQAIFANFQEGEIATFDQIKKRIFGNKQNITYIKVLGGGKADKNITVIASAFSRAAEKIILDAGGKAITNND